MLRVILIHFALMETTLQSISMMTLRYNLCYCSFRTIWMPSNTPKCKEDVYFHGLCEPEETL